MGKRIPYDAAMRMGGLEIRSEIIFPVPNRYGYRVNINHPQVRPLYEAYHRHIGVPLHIHLTGKQRLHFEALLFRMIERREHVQQSDPDGSSDP